MPVTKYLTILIIAGLLTSCSTSHKTKSSHQTSSDSSAQSSTVKKGISTSNSNELHQQDSAYQNEVTLEFGAEDTTQKANDYTGAEPTKRDFSKTHDAYELPHEITYNGKTFSSSRPIKSATFKEAGQTRKMDAQQLQKKDSGQSSEQNKVIVQREESSKEKEVRRSGANPLIWISVGLGGLVLIWLGWKFDWLAIFRRKDPLNDIKSKI